MSRLLSFIILEQVPISKLGGYSFSIQEWLEIRMPVDPFISSLLK